MKILQKPVKKYIDRLQGLIDARQNRFSQDELMAIAWETGMTESEYISLREEIYFYLERSHSYITMKRWDEALEEVEAACQLDPLNPYTLWNKAHLYVSWWKDDENHSHKAKAKEVLRYCLELNPQHQPSVELLEEIAQWKRKKRGFAITKAVGAILLIAVSISVVLLFQHRQHTEEAVHEHEVGEKYLVPSEVYVPSHLIGVKMKVGAVKVGHPADEEENHRVQYEYSGNIVCDSLELAKVACQVNFMDSSGAILATEYFQLLDGILPDGSYDSRRSMHPGDMFSFNRKNKWGLPISSKEHPKVALVEFKLQDSQAQLVTEEFDSYQRVRLPWGIRRPHYLRMSAYNRLDTLLFNPYDSLVTHNAQIAIEHRGRRACSHLKLAISWKDKKGKTLKKQIVSVLDTNMIPLQPKQKLLVSSKEFFQAPEYSYSKPFDRLSIKVLEAY